MKKEGKRCELAVVLRLLSEGKRKDEILKILEISKENRSSLGNALRRLEKRGCIIRHGKFEVQVLRSSLNNPEVTINQINRKMNKRGHAHNFTILFPQEKDLRKKPEVQNLFKKRDKNDPEKRWLEELGFGSLKMSLNRYTVWINKESLTLYSNNSYYSKDAFKTKFMAMKEVDLAVRYLKKKFQFKGIYGIEIFREHYGLIFNKFAQWLLKKGRKMRVKDKGNKSILWVDDSEEDDIGLKEFEGKDPHDINSADEKFFEQHEKTGWKVGPEFVLEGFSKQQQISGQIIEATKDIKPTMDHLTVNLKTHFAVLDKIGEASDRVALQIKEQNKLFAKMLEILGKNGG